MAYVKITDGGLAGKYYDDATGLVYRADDEGDAYYPVWDSDSGDQVSYQFANVGGAYGTEGRQLDSTDSPSKIDINGTQYVQLGNQFPWLLPDAQTNQWNQQTIFDERYGYLAPVDWVTKYAYETGGAPTWMDTWLPALALGGTLAAVAPAIIAGATVADAGAVGAGAEAAAGSGYAAYDAGNILASAGQTASDVGITGSTAGAVEGASAAGQAATGITAQQVATMGAAQTAEWIVSQGGTLAEAAAGALETATQTGLAVDAAAAQQAVQAAIDAGFTTESIQAASEAARAVNAGPGTPSSPTINPSVPTPPGSTAPNAAQTAASTLGTAATNALINGAVGAAAGALVDAVTGANDAGDANNAAAQAALNRQMAIIEEQFAHWKTNFKPIEEALAAESATYGSPEEQERAAGKARADVAQSFANQRGQKQRLMASYGINPSSGRFAGMERASNLAEAKTDAWAQNTAREREKTLGFGKKMDVVGIGRGIPASVTTGLSNSANQNASLANSQFWQNQYTADQARRGIAPVVSSAGKLITDWFNTPKDPMADYISRFGINNLSLDDPAYG